MARMAARGKKEIELSKSRKTWKVEIVCLYVVMQADARPANAPSFASRLPFCRPAY